MRTNIFFLSVAIGLFGGMLQARELVIDTVERPGKIRWTSPSLNVTGRVEWASSPAGPWYPSWSNQQTIVVNSTSNQTEVPMLFRVVWEHPDPHLPDITAAQSLDLLASRQADPEFVVLDVRTASEYSGLHVTGALNINFYASTFSTQLDALDKDKVYLLYCASGNRSGQAHDVMRGLGFHEVYNMLGGIGAFQQLPGANAYLE